MKPLTDFPRELQENFLREILKRNPEGTSVGNLDQNYARTPRLSNEVRVGFIKEFPVETYLL